MRSLRTFFVGRGRVEEATYFFLNFFANLKLMIALNFFWKVLWRIRFTDTALNFSMVKGFFCIREEHWTGLGLDWIRTIANFVKF